MDFSAHLKLIGGVGVFMVCVDITFSYVGPIFYVGAITDFELDLDGRDTESRGGKLRHPRCWNSEKPL